MKSKRFLCIALAALTALSLCACGKNGGEPAASPEQEAAATAEPTAAPEPTRAPKPTVFHYDLDIPVYTEYDLLRPIDWTMSYDQYGSAFNFNDYRMENMLARFPTDAVRSRFDGSKYAIYDTDTGYRLFVFFDYPYGNKNSPLFATGFPLLIKEVHSYADFASVEIGDPIDNVIRIDPLDSPYVNSYEGMPQFRNYIHQEAEHGHPIAFVHYLTDGVLKIAYDMTEDGRLIVYDMVYSEDYKITGNTGEVFCYKLFDIDLPPQ